MSESPTDIDAHTATRAWQLMAHFVIDNRGPWRKAITSRTGLPFGNIRLLRRLGHGPMTITDLAAAATIDAPAATVGINELEKRGLAQRTVDPDNRRRKLVSLTDDGQAMLSEMMTMDDPAPNAFDALDRDEVATLLGLLSKLEDAGRG